MDGSEIGAGGDVSPAPTRRGSRAGLLLRPAPFVPLMSPGAGALPGAGEDGGSPHLSQPPRASSGTGLPRTPAPGRARGTAERKSNYSGAGLINSLLTAFAFALSRRPRLQKPPESRGARGILAPTGNSTPKPRGGWECGGHGGRGRGGTASPPRGFQIHFFLNRPWEGAEPGSHRPPPPTASRTPPRRVASPDLSQPGAGQLNPSQNPGRKGKTPR